MKKLLLAILIISFSVTAKGQLTGMNPNTAGPGQTLQTTVTGPGLFIQASSPSGNLFSVILTNGPTTLTLFDWGNFIFNNITVLSTDSFITDYFQVPYNATSGQYLLTVVTGDVFDPWINQQTYTLPNAFTVLPPDGYINGNIYDDVNKNGIKDAGELGLPNQEVRVMPENYYIMDDVNGDYSVPAMNGNHTVQWLASGTYNYQLSSDSASYTVTVNSNTQGGFDFGLKPALISMSINYAEIGQIVSTTITADGIFTSPPINVVLSNGLYIYATNVSVIDSNHISCTFSIPFSAGYIGNHWLNVLFNNGDSYFLNSAFTVTAFNAGITGKAFYDANGNGVYDAGDTTISNSKVELTPGNNLSYTNNSGNYGFGTANGNYTVTYFPRYYETVTTAASYNVTVSSNIQVRDFGVQITPTFDSLSLYIWHWLFRCNTPQSVYAYVVNNGGSPAKGRLVMIQDPAMGTIATTPPPDYYSNDTLFWNFASLPTGQTFTVLPTFTAPAAGTPLNFKFFAQQLDAGNNVIFSEEQDYSEVVSCSYDPNEKLAQPPGVQAPHYTLFGDDLYYTIRFQNTGNDTAFRVIILDTLDTDLDYTTFQFITSTHPCTTELNPANGALKFTFKNILLPDSNTNEPASHGEVTYRIKTQTGLAANTIINNTAYIVFDLNTPVVTDTTFNTMVYVIPVGMDETETSANGVNIYPNPFDHSAWLTFSNDNNEKFNLTITDPNGRKLLEKEISSDNYLIEKGNLNEGMYFYKLSNKNRTINFSGKFAVK